MGAAHHHAVQGGRVLGDVDHYGAHLEDGGVVGLQAALGAVQRLRFGDGAFDDGSETQENTGEDRKDTLSLRRRGHEDEGGMM